MFHNIVSDSNYHRFVKSFCLIICLRVIRISLEMLGIRKSTHCFLELIQNWHVFERKGERMDAVSCGHLIQENIRNVRRCCLLRTDSPNKFRVTIRDDHNIVFPTRSLQKVADDFYSYKI